jgi:hypothetical protein
VQRRNATHVAGVNSLDSHSRLYCSGRRRLPRPLAYSTSVIAAADNDATATAATPATT